MSSMDGKIPRRWALALVGLAIEAGAEDGIQKDLEHLNIALLSGDRALFRALKSPVFSLEERQGVLDEVLRRVPVHAMTRKFMKLLTERARVGALPKILEHYTKHMDARAGRVLVQITTVEELSAEFRAELITSFERTTGKQVRLDTRIDPSLIGGIVARVGGTVYDASVRTRLQHIKRRLIHAQA